MRIGILGSGLMGGKLGTIFRKPDMRWYSATSVASIKLEVLARDAKAHWSSLIGRGAQRAVSQNGGSGQAAPAVRPQRPEKAHCRTGQP
jgi:hypothetical protein